MRIEDIDRATKLKEKYRETQCILAELKLFENNDNVTLNFGAAFHRPIPESIRELLYHMLKDYYMKEQDDILQEITNL